MASLTISENIQLWRQKSRDGTITLEEMRMAVAAIRRERVMASDVSAVSRERKARAKAPPIDTDAMLRELF